MDQTLAIALQRPVASVLLVLILVMSIVALWNEKLIDRWALHPYSFFRQKRYYTLLTSGFVHANTFHLIVNGLTFYFFAFALEHAMLRMEVKGIEPGDQSFAELTAHFKFAVLYFGSLIIADIPALFRRRNQEAFSSVGASGAISGIVSAQILYLTSLSTGLSLRIFGIVPLWVFGIIFIVGSYLLGRFNRNDKIAHDAHAWGAVAGTFIFLLFYPDVRIRLYELIAAQF